MTRPEAYDPLVLAVAGWSTSQPSADIRANRSSPSISVTPTAIDRFDDLVAEWIPRLAYTSTALLVGYGLIHSGAFMPSLPQELR